MKEKQFLLRELTEMNYWNSSFDDRINELSADDLSRLMYYFIEKNVQHDASQRHMMYDLLDKIEEKFERSWITLQRD